MNRREFNIKFGLLKRRLTAFGNACQNFDVDSEARWREQALLEKEMEALFEQVAAEGITESVTEEVER